MVGYRKEMLATTKIKFCNFTEFFVRGFLSILIFCVLFPGFCFACLYDPAWEERSSYLFHVCLLGTFLVLPALGSLCFLFLQKIFIFLSMSPGKRNTKLKTGKLRAKALGLIDKNRKKLNSFVETFFCLICLLTYLYLPYLPTYLPTLPTYPAYLPTLPTNLP